jgi:hypothetical protein
MRPVITLAMLLALGAPAMADPTETQEPTPAVATAAPAEVAEQAPPQVPSVPATHDFAPAMAQEWTERQFSIGGAYLDDEQSSSRLHEYRSLHEGAVVPFIRFRGERSFKFDLRGVNVGQDDMRLNGLLQNEALQAVASWTRIPHMFGENGRILVDGPSYAASAANQAAIERQYAVSRPGVNFAFLNRWCSRRSRARRSRTPPCSATWAASTSSCSGTSRSRSASPTTTRSATVRAARAPRSVSATSWRRPSPSTTARRT